MVSGTKGRGHVITVTTPAKLNTYLKVLKKRDDGYHEIVSIMLPVTLCDILHFSLSSSGISLSCEGRPLDCSEKNLVYRACLAFYEKTGIHPGIKVELVKQIPIAAGLGGGSSDAACTLSILNLIHKQPLKFKELEGLAVSLGADVPFFLYHRPCLAQGIGDILTPIENWPSFWYVIIVPPLEVSTAWVYGSLKLELTENRHSYIINRLKRLGYNRCDVLENDLETVTQERFPQIAEIKALLKEAGAQGALMSGSGSSVFGVFRTKDQALNAKRTLEDRELGEIFVTTLWRKAQAGQRL